MIPQRDHDVVVEYWLGFVRLGWILSLVAALLTAAYVALLPAAGGRWVVAVVVAVVGLTAPLIARLPWRRWVEVGAIETALVIWSTGSVAMLTVAVVADGGLRSPLLLLYTFPWAFSAVAYTPRAAALVGAQVAAASVVVSAMTPGGSIARATEVVGTLVTMAGLGVLISINNHRRLERTAQLTRRLEDLADVDGLTGCRTHRSFHETLDALTHTAVRSGTSLAVLMVDVDHFKQINDAHGHAVGDRALAVVGRQLSGSVRDVDVVGRLGGEEFAVAMPGATHDDARAIADRLHRAVEQVRDPVRLAVSIGAAAAQPDDADDGSVLLRQADAALYAAKQAGRGRTRWHPAARGAGRDDLVAG